jgi:uncharacterized protein YbjT (DUF2867 family)
MRVFVAGASGGLGSRLVPQLISAGHEVLGTHNSPATAVRLRQLGAKPVAVDLLDARAWATPCSTASRRRSSTWTLPNRLFANH